MRPPSKTNDGAVDPPGAPVYRRCRLFRPAMISRCLLRILASHLPLAMGATVLEVSRLQPCLDSRLAVGADHHLLAGVARGSRPRLGGGDPRGLAFVAHYCLASRLGVLRVNGAARRLQARRAGDQCESEELKCSFHFRFLCAPGGLDVSRGVHKPPVSVRCFLLFVHRDFLSRVELWRHSPSPFRPLI